MPQPSISSVHQNRALDSVAIAYSNEEYVLDQVFPIVPVDKESDVYHVWTKGDFFRREAKAVAPGARAPRGGFTLQTPQTYTTDCIKFAWPIPDRIAKNMDTPVRALVNGTQLAMDQVLLEREAIVATLLSTVANWTATRSGLADGGTLAIGGGNEWNTANGTPVANIQIAKQAVRQSIGRRANTMVISDETAEALVHNQEILDLVRNTIVDRPVIIDLAAIAALFRIPRIITCSAMYNSAKEGQAVTLLPLLGDTAWIGYVAPSPSIMMPSAGYTFVVNQPSMRTWREDAEEQDVTEAALNFIPKVTAADAGFTITNTLG